MLIFDKLVRQACTTFFYVKQTCVDSQILPYHLIFALYHTEPLPAQENAVYGRVSGSGAQEKRGTDRQPRLNIDL